MSTQADWRWCKKCQGLFFSGSASQGVCPADHQAHDASQSGQYLANLNEETKAAVKGSLPTDTNLVFSASAQQGDWRWCHKCQALFFAGSPTQGVCPADKKTHDASQSGHYASTIDDGIGNLGQWQVGWRWCHKCQGFFFDENASKGVCPADSLAHDASQSGKYQMQEFVQAVATAPIR